AQTVTLTPKSGSPLAGLPVTLACTIKDGLDVANVVSTPDFDRGDTSYSWAVTGKTKSGTFQLSLAGKGMTTPITVAISKLVSSNLADEFSGVYSHGKVVDIVGEGLGLKPSIGDQYFHFRLNDLSPLRFERFIMNVVDGDVPGGIPPVTPGYGVKNEVVDPSGTGADNYIIWKFYLSGYVGNVFMIEIRAEKLDSLVRVRCFKVS
ncbi:hypothetical protein PMI28_00636, partial [Pseudomonas sp. GM48]